MPDTLATYAARIDRARAGLRSSMGEVLADAGHDAEREARRFAASRWNARQDAQAAIGASVSGLEMRLRGDDARVRFLRIQEEGGRVTPKRGRYLLLPPSNGRGWARVRSVTIRPKHAIRDGMAAVVPSFREAAKARLRDLVAHGE